MVWMINRFGEVVCCYGFFDVCSVFFNKIYMLFNIEIFEVFFKFCE